jgi:hypothetical protein
MRVTSAAATEPASAKNWPRDVAARAQIAEVAQIPKEFTIVCSLEIGQEVGHPVKK